MPIGKLNLYAAIAHGIAFITFAILMLSILRPEFRVTNLFRITPVVDPNEPARDSVNRPAELKTFFGISIVFLVLLFFGFTIFFHLLYYSNSKPGQWYANFIKQGHNPVRWLEYAISAGIMSLIICLISGVREINGTWAVVLSIASLMIQGAIVERQLILPTPDLITVKYATLAGWTLLLTAWTPIAFTLLNVIKDIRDNPQYTNRVPAWIPLFTFFQLFQFAVFGFVQLKQVRALLNRAVLPAFQDIERSYIINSFSTKLVLGSFIAYGLLDRQRRSDDWR